MHLSGPMRNAALCQNKGLLQQKFLIRLSACLLNVNNLQLEAQHACCESSAHAALRLIALSVQDTVF